MLHAALLAIEHPITGELLVLNAPPREEMLAQLCEHLTEHSNSNGCVPPGRLGISDAPAKALVFES